MRCINNLTKKRESDTLNKSNNQKSQKTQKSQKSQKNLSEVTYEKVLIVKKPKRDTDSVFSSNSKEEKSGINQKEKESLSKKSTENNFLFFDDKTISSENSFELEFEEVILFLLIT